MPSMAELLREMGGQVDATGQLLKGMALEPVAGLGGLSRTAIDMLRGRGVDRSMAAGAKTVEDIQGWGGGPMTQRGKQRLGELGGMVETATEKVGSALGHPIDKVGEVSPAAAAAILASVEGLDPTKGMKAGRAAKTAGRAAKAAPEVGMVPSVRAALEEAVGPQNADIARSLKNDPKYKAGVPEEVITKATTERARLRQEPNALPKPAEMMSPEDWQAWGQQHGVDMTLSPRQSLGVSDLATRQEITVPGGLEGKFTIPDVFDIKANNFDPNVLGQDTHNALMQKFLRTYDRPEGMDATDRFNALNFALLSPNAPLTQNEFLAQRLRATGPTDLDRVAAMTPDEARAQEMGTGAASRGGMGVKGTADLGNQPHLARILRDNPEVFDVGPGETLKDVGRRTMNQVPGLGPKTASLGVPWLDLPNANTSAVDLHMIRNNYPRLMDDPELGPEFTARIASLVGQEGVDSTFMKEMISADPEFARRVEDAAIKVIGGDQIGMKYRLKGGELNPNLNPAIMPEKLAFEPEQAQEFNPYYNRVVDYVDQSRGANPELALFPEQWRLWDRYRARVEPHEMAHPDFRKLPKMSWSEMQKALEEHKRLGYTGTKLKPEEKTSWGRMYYGKARPDLLAAMAAGAGGSAVLSNLLREEEQKK